MIKEKILGLILLLVGLLIIGYSLFLGVNVFINAKNPPEIFKPISSNIVSNKTQSKNVGSKIDVPKNLNEINPDEIQKMISNNLINPEMIKSVIPSEIFSYTVQIMNFTVFLIFLWILIIAGAKISSLGISLIKINSDIKF